MTVVIELCDSWVEVHRNERDWLNAQGFGDDAHGLSHPTPGERFVIIGRDEHCWIQVLSPVYWLARDLSHAIWIHPEVVRPFREKPNLYSLANDTDIQSMTRSWEDDIPVLDVRDGSVQMGSMVQRWLGHALRHDPRLDYGAKNHYGSCHVCAARMWDHNPHECQSILLWVLRTLMVELQSLGVRCRGGKHRSNMIACGAALVSGSNWIAHRHRCRTGCDDAATGCQHVTRREILNWCQLQYLIGHGIVVNELRAVRAA